MANERLQGEEQYHSENYLLEIPRSHAKVRLKSAPQKLKFAMAKAISKSYTLDCSRKYPCTYQIPNTLARFHKVTHSSAASFLIKSILCETSFLARTMEN